MAERITVARLRSLADDMTELFHEAGLIEDNERVAYSGAYGGHTLLIRCDDTGGCREFLTSGHNTTRATWDAAKHFQRGVYAARRGKL